MSIDTPGRRFALSLSVVTLAYAVFGVWAHLTDPRWPPLAFGAVRPAVELLTWPGVRISTLLVLTGTNPFPSGAAYLSIWGLSMGAYVLLLFGGLSVVASLSGSVAKPRLHESGAAEQADAADEVRVG